MKIIFIDDLQNQKFRAIVKTHKNVAVTEEWTVDQWSQRKKKLHQIEFICVTLTLTHCVHDSQYFFLSLLIRTDITCDIHRI